MLGDIFYWVFNMSIMATVTGFVILLLERIKKLPRRLIFILWAIPFVRMLMPFGLQSEYSIMNLLSKLGTKTVVVWETKVFDYSFSNSAKAVESYFPMEYKTNELEKIFDISALVWVAIAVVILTILAFAYFSANRDIKSAIHLKDNIYLSEKVNSPVVYGIFKGKIVVPMAYKDKDLDFILAHENAHIKRKDNLWRVIAITITSIHWFNPFVWLFLKHFLSTMELSCDERVLSNLGEDQKKAYATVLLESAEAKTLTASAFGGAKTRKRIENILEYKKISAVSILFFTALAISIAYILLTNAK